MASGGAGETRAQKGGGIEFSQEAGTAFAKEACGAWEATVHLFGKTLPLEQVKSGGK